MGLAQIGNDEPKGFFPFCRSLTLYNLGQKYMLQNYLEIENQTVPQFLNNDQYIRSCCKLIFIDT